ncbi:MAG: hypothetical protein PF487_10365, partial [Bacteroidales bacterium]|nr:hypothetical protein [Bacteroidales bacterium]
MKIGLKQEVHDVGFFDASGTTTTTSPSVITKPSDVTIDSIPNTGGISIVRWEDVNYYGMQYRETNLTNPNSWIL